MLLPSGRAVRQAFLAGGVCGMVGSRQTRGPEDGSAGAAPVGAGIGPGGWAGATAAAASRLLPLLLLLLLLLQLCKITEDAGPSTPTRSPPLDPLIRSQPRQGRA